MTIARLQTQEPQIQTKPTQSKAQRLENVAQEYETLFAKMLMKSMYKSLDTSKSLFSSKNSVPQKLFDDMLYEQYARVISEQKALGIRTLITEHYKDIT